MSDFYEMQIYDLKEEIKELEKDNEELFIQYYELKYIPFIHYCKCDGFDVCEYCKENKRYLEARKEK